MSAVVLVQHPVPDFDAWMKMFESDPAGRRENNVRRYWIYRTPESDYVVVGLEFDTVDQATEFRAHLESAIGHVWERFGTKETVARVLEEVERAEL